MAADDDAKTEEPTPRRLEQAREKGDVIYSPEVGAALSLAAATALAAFMSGPIAAELGRALAGFLAAAGEFSTDAGALRAIGASIGLKLLAVFALAAIALAGAGIAARFVQDRPVFSAQRLSPSLDRLNPVAGFKRVFGKQAGASFVKSLVKLAVVGAALAWALWPRDASLERLSLLDPAALLPFVQERVVAMMLALTAAAAVLAAIDYVFTRQSYMQRQRMSRRELKEELRQSDGDPVIKAKLRQIRVERSRRRMLANVPNASVVIVNPTHYAVALRYEPSETPAPVCLAMGVDAVAQRIRAAAEEHDIPIVEDPPLARALFATAELDRPIPREHYEAVAKVIGFVMRMARRRGRRATP